MSSLVLREDHDGVATLILSGLSSTAPVALVLAFLAFALGLAALPRPVWRSSEETAPARNWSA